MVFSLDFGLPRRNAGLLNRSIGISPPRLHHGRAANYGSIINLCTCHRRPGTTRFLQNSLARSLQKKRSWRAFCRGSEFLAPMQRTYFSDSGIFNCQGTMKGSLYFTLLLTSQREGRKYSIFHKKVHFLCFAQRVYPGYPAMQSWPILTSRRRRQKYK